MEPFSTHSSIPPTDYQADTIDHFSDHYNPGEYYEEEEEEEQQQKEKIPQFHGKKSKSSKGEPSWNRMDVLVNKNELASSYGNRQGQGIMVRQEYRPPQDRYYNDVHTTMTTPGQHNNSTGPDIIIRGEEVGIVLVVLVLWVGAIILFFNRWGKIRMLEPYQPKFCEHHNPNCPMADPIPPISTTYPMSRTFSKFNLASDLPSGSPHFSKCNYHGVTASSTTTAAVEPLLSASHHHGFFPQGMSHSLGVPGSLTLLGGGVSPRLGQRNRPRQNSVFVTSPNYSPGTSLFGNGGGQVLKNTSRKTKSAVDLSTLVLCGEFMDNVRRNSKNSITNL